MNPVVTLSEVAMVGLALVICSSDVAMTSVGTSEVVTGVDSCAVVVTMEETGGEKEPD